MNRPQQHLITAARHAFLQHFGQMPTTLVQAPGRVNLMGEHTDYNDGYVLPCAINFGTVIAARRRDDAMVRVVAVDMDMAFDGFRLDEIIEPLLDQAEQQWANYVRGMLRELQLLGLSFSGMELAITGDVPQGAGLSSSASLTVAVGQAVKSLFSIDTLDATQLAQAAQRAENNFVGCQCGIMDQLVSAHGKVGHAVLIDCRSLQTRQVLLADDVSVLVVHSRVARGLVDSEYNTRRKQCEAAARYFGVAALRDVNGEQVSAASGLDQMTMRRARHVVTENQRAQEAAVALAQGDLRRMGELMAASHASMRNDFEITLPPIDELVAILGSAIGEMGGARMTGGGFGGCVVAVLPTAMVKAASDAVAAQYRAPHGESALVYACVPSAGAGSLAL